MALVRRPAQAPPEQDRRDREREPHDLREQLAAEDGEQRRRAALDLWGDPDAVPALLAAHAVERDPVVREALLTTLAGQDTPVVGWALAEDLRSEDPGVRNAAVRALQAMPVAVAALVADGVLEDPDADVRILAVMVLSAVTHPDVPVWLHPLVASDPDPRVVAAAVDVALTIGGEVAGELAPAAAARFPQDPYLAFLASTAGRP